MPSDLALSSTLISSNYPCLELIFMVPKVFEHLKFDCIMQKSLDNKALQKSLDNKASQVIQSPRTGPFFLLISSVDGYLFANVQCIIEFKHLKKKKKCDLDIKQRPLKHEPVQEICMKFIKISLKMRRPEQ